MKVGIIGDVHLGANSSYGTTNVETQLNTRLIDYASTLYATIDRIFEEGAQSIIFTGDIFEHRKPTLVQQKFFSQALYYALDKGIKEIHIVVGNHDQQRLSQATTLGYLKELHLSNIHVHDEFSLIAMKDDNNKSIANFIFMPYRDRKWFGVETYDEAIECVRRDLDFKLKEIKNDLPKVVVGHFTIEGTLFNAGYADLYNENQLFLPKTLFDQIDITVMGHIHEPQVISQKPYIAYVGSMEKRGSFENHDKLYAIIDFDTSDISYKKEPCRDIFDIDIDFSSIALGKSFQSKIYNEIEKFSNQHKLEKTITRINLKMLSDDEPFLNTRHIMEHLKDKYLVNNCLEIIPTIFSPRQARDDRITEKLSDAEAFKIFINNTIEDGESRKAIISTGLDIIKILENEDASYQD